MNAVGLLKRNPEPARQEIIDSMENSLCRCGTHNCILDAVLTCCGRIKNKG